MLIEIPIKVISRYFQDLQDIDKALGLSRGMGSNVWVFKEQNGEYGGAEEPPEPQNFVRPSK
jgi:hypothetical protein